jgi:hypothetical protein
MNQSAEIDVQEQELRYHPSFSPIATGGSLGNTITSATMQTMTGYSTTTNVTVQTMTGYLSGQIQVFTGGLRNMEASTYQHPTTHIARSRPSPGRVTGPVQVLKQIFADWDLSRQEVASLLAYFDPQIATTYSRELPLFEGSTEKIECV